MAVTPLIRRILVALGGWNTLAVLAVGSVGAAIGLALQLPAGALIGSVLAVAAGHSLRLGYRQVPRGYNEFIKILAGALAGLALTPATLLPLLRIGPAILISVAFVVSVGLAAGYVLHRLGYTDAATALYASAPGGMSEMVSSAHEAGADMAIVGTLHLLRLVSVVVLTPPLTVLLARLLG